MPPARPRQTPPGVGAGPRLALPAPLHPRHHIGVHVQHDTQCWDARGAAGLLRHRAACPRPALAHTIRDYSKWEEHFTILANGSLVIDQFGWRDRGEYACYVDNGAGAELARVELSLDHRYRSIVYY